MRRITLVASGLDVGGAELQLSQLALGLRQRGWDVQLISLQKGGRYATELRDAGLKVDMLPTSRLASPIRLIRLIRAIRHQDPDLVQTFAFRANLWGRIAALCARKPVVASIRATYSYIPRVYFPVERALSRKTEYVIAPSRSTARHLSDRLRLPKHKIVAIPNGVRPEGLVPAMSREQARSALNLPDDAFIILCAARLVPFKNQNGLISAVESMPRSPRRSLLILAGDGPMREELLERAAASAEQIRLLGEVSRSCLGRLMVAADVVALMSEFEGMPNVVLEAMMCGTPVVATAVDGTSELIVDQGTGLLVPRGDIVAMSNALCRLRDDSPLRDTLGEAARNRALKDFTADVNVERFVKVYERVLGGAAGG